MRSKYGRRKRGRKRYSRRKYRRVRKVRSAASNRIRGLVVPDRLFVKMRYSEQYTLTTATGLIARYVMSMNSLYDPDHTSTGKQPTGYDQWSNFYKRYRVHGSKISVKSLVPNPQTNAQFSGYIGVLPANEAITTADSFDELIMRPYATYRNTTLHAPWMGNIKKYMSVAKLFGAPKKAISIDDTYSGLLGDTGTGSDPIREGYWNIFWQCVDQAQAASIVIRVTVTYYAELWDRYPLSTS